MNFHLAYPPWGKEIAHPMPRARGLLLEWASEASLHRRRGQPNPARTQVTLRGAHGTMFDQVSVYNLTGMNVYKESVALTDRHTLNTNGWSPGIYMVMATHSLLSKVYYAKLFVVR